MVIGAFAVIHGVNLAADFPNHTPWYGDWAKYTDEGWYGNAAIRMHLLGHWYIPGDFNPAVAVPVLPFFEWILFFFTGVSVEAARGLTVAFFFANLILCYALLRPRGPRWMALLALTFMVTSPFLYCFSRLAILEPLLTTLTLAALNLTVRLPRLRHLTGVSILIGLLFTLMILTKTSAAFLAPALGWAMFVAFLERSDAAASATRSSIPTSVDHTALRCAGWAIAASLLSFGLWISFVAALGYYADYRYFFFINHYVKPTEFYWPLLGFWWSLHGSIWIDRILIPLAGVLIIAALLAPTFFSKGTKWGNRLALDPVFGASVLGALGYIVFMTYQNHPQPRYFAVVAVFCFLVAAMSVEALVSAPGSRRLFGLAALAASLLAVIVNAMWTLNYATHPEYSFVTAARGLTRYIDDHPNGKRLLMSLSGDEITLITHLPTLCDDFSVHTAQYPDLPAKLVNYQPGWWATWNDIDRGTLEDIHRHFSLEQVAQFRAFDDPERNLLVLFKLHPLPNGQTRTDEGSALQVPLPGDKILIPIQ